ncbi:HutD-domain-containing protein [Globomyces pollinis-pini]|nr:HutD-domain-containing protein [Globomyces pollinis-pini]
MDKSTEPLNIPSKNSNTGNPNNSVKDPDLSHSLTSPLLSQSSLNNFTLFDDLSNPQHNFIILPKSQYSTSKWKNGLGETTLICIEPAEANPLNDPFLWKLSKSTISTSTNLALFPDYDQYVVLLSDELPTGRLNLFHHDNQIPIQLKPWVPYQYQGHWNTHANVAPGPPIHLLGLMAHKNKTKVTMSVETICSNHNLADLADPSTTHITVLYVIKGSIFYFFNE